MARQTKNERLQNSVSTITKGKKVKKTMLTMAIMGSALLNAQNYTGEATHTAESKKEACEMALQNAKSYAMEEAGTIVSSNFNSIASDTNGKISMSNQRKLTSEALGIAKLKTKSEDVKASDNYQFTCKVVATFEIDQDEVKATLKEMIKKQAEEEKLAGYFEADAHSEEGQSKYKAFSAATLLAQRNLLEVVMGADITSLTKMDRGVVEIDKIGKLISGSLVGAEVVKKEYDSETKSAYVMLRVKKVDIAKTIEDSINQ